MDGGSAITVRLMFGSTIFQCYLFMSPSIRFWFGAVEGMLIITSSDDGGFCSGRKGGGGLNIVAA